MNASLTLANIIYVLAIIANLAIAVFVYVNNPKHASNRLFLALSIAISTWLAAMLATNLRALLPWYLQFARLTLLFATPMDLFFFLFAHTVPDSGFKMGRRWLVALFCAALIVIGISVSPLAFSGLLFVNEKPETIAGPGMAVFGLFQMTMFIGAVFSLFMKMRRRPGEERLQLRLILLGFMLMFGMIFGTIFIPVLLLGDATFVQFAPLYALLFTGFSGYAIFRRNMLNVKVAAAELFSAGLMFINIILLFLSGSVVDFALRLFTFVVVCVFSLMFIHSVHEEVKRREELSEMTVQLAEANTHLEELDNTKSEFISIASHQLRTPISVLKGYISLILEGAYGKVSPALKEKLEQMFIMNERLVHLINNLLSLSRIEKNKVEYVCSYFDAATLTREVVDELQFKAKEKKLELRFKPPTETLPKIYADPDKLREIIINLTDNAIKYTPKGWVEWTLRAGTGSEGVVFTISDSGVGMSEEESRSIFKKFYRASQEGQKREKGTGLGLFVCVRFAQGMGGRVWIERTAPKEGTTFAVSLPTSPAVECEPAPDDGKKPALTA